MQICELIHLIPALAGREFDITPLSGGITNRNYRVDTKSESFVLRIGEPAELLGIDRTVEYACSLAAAKLGVGPEVIAFLPEHCALVTRFVAGRVLRPEDTREPVTMRRVVAALHRYHDGPPGSGECSPFETIRRYHQLARDRGVGFPDVMADALNLLAQIEAPVPPTLYPCHNDLLPANLMDDGSSIWIIDWEYAGMGDRFFDLGNLVANNSFEGAQERMLLEIYFGEIRDEDLRRLHQMRLVSDLRESLWGFLQSAISTLDFDFREYGQSHLRRFLEAATTLEPGSTVPARGG